MSGEKCSNCEQMKIENKTLRRSIDEINKNYVEVINENLALRRELEKVRNA
jgi:regulator of replication initiation timing